MLDRPVNLWILLLLGCMVQGILSWSIGCGGIRYKNLSLPTEPIYHEQTGAYWQAAYTDCNGMAYLITFPASYEQSPNQPYPVILFLHSMAEWGEPIEAVIENTKQGGEGNGLAAYALADVAFPFLTVSPLCPSKKYWPRLDTELNDLLEELFRYYPLDRTRCYGTGVSMGGMGIWQLAMTYPDWFTAIAPISGGIYDPPMDVDLRALKTQAIWAFHDRFDEEIPLEKEESFIHQLQQAGYDVTYSITETGRHFIHESIYEDGKLFKWFLTHRRE